jgi:hypothetical protein
LGSLVSVPAGVGDGGHLVHFEPFGPGPVEGVDAQGAPSGGQAGVADGLLVRPEQPKTHLS